MGTVEKLKNLFPSKAGFGIFLAYMALFVNQGLLVTASRNGEKTYPYNPTTVVLLTEVLKLIFSVTAFLRNNSCANLVKELVANVKVLGYYMVPAFLYCLYNNLSFANLVHFDPTSYFMFLQIRMLLTGFIYQFLFNRKLSNKQWISLLLVTIGCMIQKLDLNQIQSYRLDSLATQETFDQWKLAGLFLILIQVSCSVFAGVYNEYLIKNVAGSKVDIMVQNVYMYLDSILCNLVVLCLKGQFFSAVSVESVQSIFQGMVLAIIVNNALIGIVTSLFLKLLDSILKSFASALELVFTAIFSFLLLGIPIYVNTVVAVGIVAYAVVLYARNPIKSQTLPVRSDNKDVVIRVESSHASKN